MITHVEGGGGGRGLNKGCSFELSSVFLLSPSHGDVSPSLLHVTLGGKSLDGLAVHNLGMRVCC